jgi:hypothetical protein
MNRTGHSCRIRHASYFRAANETAEVVKVGLYYVDASIRDGPQEAAEAELLLATGDGNFQGVGDFPGFPEMVEGAGFFEEGVVVIFQQSTDTDRVRYVIGAIRIGVQSHFVAEGFASQGDQGLGSSGK